MTTTPPTRLGGRFAHKTDEALRAAIMFFSTWRAFAGIAGLHWAQYVLWSIGIHFIPPVVAGALVAVVLTYPMVLAALAAAVSVFRRPT